MGAAHWLCHPKQQVQQIVDQLARPLVWTKFDLVFALG